MQIYTALRDNTMILTGTGLKDDAGALVADADLTVEILSAARAALTDPPIPFPALAGAPGSYRAVMDWDAAWQPGKYLRIRGTSPSGAAITLTNEWRPATRGQPSP